MDFLCRAAAHCPPQRPNVVDLEDRMASRALFHLPLLLVPKKSRRTDLSRRVDFVVGLLAACAMIAFFIVAYFAFSPPAIVP
jgi:hypothetical protein